MFVPHTHNPHAPHTCRPLEFQTGPVMFFFIPTPLFPPVLVLAFFLFSLDRVPPGACYLLYAIQTGVMFSRFSRLHHMIASSGHERRSRQQWLHHASPPIPAPAQPYSSVYSAGISVLIPVVNRSSSKQWDNQSEAWLMLVMGQRNPRLLRAELPRTASNLK